VRSLEEAADLDRQRAAWVDRTDAHFPAPTELVSQVFDDSGIDDLLGTGELVFSQRTDAAIRALSALVEEMGLDEDPVQLWVSETWRGFANNAARVLALVRADLAR
jgi:hypothetical protein